MIPINAEPDTTATGRRRRQWRRIETSQRILRAAVDLFSQRGYVETTIEEIAQAADVAKGTFFNYFHSKDDVLLATLGAVGEEFAAFERGIKDATDTREYLRRFSHRFIESPPRFPLLMRSILGTILADPSFGRTFSDRLLQNSLKAHTALLRRGQKLGQVRSDIPAAILARTLQQLMLGTETLWSLSNGEDLHSWIDSSIDIFWAGISAKRERGTVRVSRSGDTNHKVK